MDDDVQMLKLRVSKFPPPNFEGPGSGISCPEEHRLELRPASGASDGRDRLRHQDPPRLACGAQGSSESGARSRQGLARAAHCSGV